MLFVCWLFGGRYFNRTKVMTYTPEHVRILAGMLRRNGGHELVCATDQPAEVAAVGVRAVTMPEAVSRLPRYYPKLWAFSTEFGEIIGRRFTSIDLDVIVTGDLGDLAATSGDFVIWNQARGEFYNSSFFNLEPGARRAVWDRFTPERAAAAETVAGRWTGDQSWIGAVLGPGERTLSERDGLLQYRPSLHRAAPVAGALAYFTCGPYRPDTEAPHSAWIRSAYSA